MKDEIGEQGFNFVRGQAYRDACLLKAKRSQQLQFQPSG